MNGSRLLAIARSLVEARSPSGDEGPALHVAERHLREAGLRVERCEVDGAARFNLLAASGRPRAILATHVDTVPGDLGIEVRGDILYGRGACDAKGAAAAMIAAADALRARGVTDFGVLLVVGEETTSDGAIAAARRIADDRTSWPAGALLLGEPTGNRWASAHPGIVILSLSASGVPAHSSTPERGLSAIHLLLDWLAAIRAEPWPVDPEMGPTQVQVGRIGGGSAANVVAEAARADVMFRSGAPVDGIIRRVRELAPERTLVEITCAAEPARFCRFGDEPAESVPFGSDAPFLTSLGDAWLLGPGAIHHAHADDEQVSGSELVAAAARYVAWVQAQVAARPR